MFVKIYSGLLLVLFLERDLTFFFVILSSRNQGARDRKPPQGGEVGQYWEVNWLIVVFWSCHVMCQYQNMRMTSALSWKTFELCFFPPLHEFLIQSPFFSYLESPVFQTGSQIEFSKVLMWRY